MIFIRKKIEFYQFCKICS